MFTHLQDVVMPYHYDDGVDVIWCFTPFIQPYITGAVAEQIERLPRSREVVGSSPGRAKPKVYKLVLVVSSLNAQH